MAEDVRIYDNVVEIDVGVDTAAHAANEVLFQPIEVPLIAITNGCAVVLSITVTDYDDQGIAMDLVFLRESVTVGANNAAMSIPDTQLQHVLGHVNIAATDYLNLPLNQVATKRNVGLELRPAAITPTSVWLTGRTTGTPTYASGRLTIKIGVLRG